MSNPTGATKKQKLAPVRVFLRIRPPHEQDGPSAVTYCTPKEICVKGHTKTYSFDQIFDEKTTQNKVYKTVVGSIIADVVKGYNCTVFAYGQTGTGKTYTILGGDTVNSADDQFDKEEDSDAGIILRAAKHLYDELDKIDQSVQYTVTVSFMEIYNEEIRDLLCDKVLPLRIYEDKTKSVRVKNLQEVTVLNIWDILSLLKKGCEKRQIASTLMNNRSSRSHTVFTINVSTIQTISVAGNISNIICGKLSLIDLAGSENIAKSGSKDQRAREASNINQSLLTLGRVIKALVENSSHIPYRESKLTRILQDSLGGKTKTAIIATISPGVSSLDETLNTLDYAFNARNVTNCPTINLRTSATAAAVHEEVIRLKRDLFATANEQGVYMDKENYEDMTKSLSEFKKDIVVKHETIKSLNEKLDDLLAQREEWDNLRKSFEITRQAYQECQSEIKSTKGMMQEAELLLDYYENKIDKSQEFTDWMAKRENYLHEKVDSLYGTSVSNKEAIEKLIKTVEKALDDMVTQDSQIFQETSSQLERLGSFKKNVCHMLQNVKKQLDEKASQCTSICLGLNMLQNESTDNPLLKLCNFSHNHMDYIEKMLKYFVERCDKVSQLNQQVEETKKYISLFEVLVQESNKTTLNEVLQKKVQTENILTEDIRRTDKLLRKIEDTVNGRMESLSKISSEADDQLSRDKEALKKRNERLLEADEQLSRDMEALEERKAQLTRDEEALKKRKKYLLWDKEQLLRDEESLKSRSEQIELTRHLELGHSFREDISKYSEERTKQKETICDFSILENGILSRSQKELQEMSTISNMMPQSTEINNILCYKDAITEMECLRDQASGFTRAMEQLLTEVANNTSDVASVVEQISSILDFEGNVQLEHLDEVVNSRVNVVSTKSKEIKSEMHQIFTTSFVPVSRTGDTPKPMRPTRTTRSSRDSIVRRLTMDTSISEENPTTSSS